MTIVLPVFGVGWFGCPCNGGYGGSSTVTLRLPTRDVSRYFPTHPFFTSVTASLNFSKVSSYSNLCVVLCKLALPKTCDMSLSIDCIFSINSTIVYFLSYRLSPINPFV